MIKVYSSSKGNKKPAFKSKTWIDCYRPNARELNDIRKLTKIDIADLKDCLDPNEKPRFEREKDYLFIIVSVLDAKRNFTKPLGVFVKNNSVLTIHSNRVLSIENLEEENFFMKENAKHFLYHLFIGIIKRFSSILEEMDYDLEDIEDSLLFVSDAEREKCVKKVFSTKKDLLYIRKALLNNKEVFNLISHNNIIKNKGYQQDLIVENMQSIDLAELLRDRTTSVIDLYLSSISNKLNEVMKSFTVIASLLLLPMLISGIYGMNFAYLPMSEYRYGFFLILLIMAFGMILMSYIFKRRGWT